jgi:hypothetical protein
MKKPKLRDPEVVSEVALGAGLFLGRLDNGDVRIRVRTKKMEGIWELPEHVWRRALVSVVSQ